MKQNPFKNLINIYLSKEDIHDVFGVIVYGEHNPFIKKVLRDNDYWNALDIISGNRWPIFAIRPSQESHISKDYQKTHNTLYMMIDIKSETNQQIKNDSILEHLEIKDTNKLPLLIVFCCDKNDSILQVRFKIDESSEDNCYKSIEKALSVVASSIECVQPPHIKNTVGIYNLMKEKLNQHIFWQRLKKAVNFSVWIKGLSP